MFNSFFHLKIQRFLDRDPNKFELHPHRAWAVIFSIAAILITLVLVFHLSFYTYMHTDSSFKPDDSFVEINEVKLNRKGLAEVTSMFETKNAQFQSFLVSPPKIMDPSFTTEQQTRFATSVKIKSDVAASPKTADNTKDIESISTE